MESISDLEDLYTTGDSLIYNEDDIDMGNNQLAASLLDCQVQEIADKVDNAIGNSGATSPIPYRSAILGTTPTQVGTSGDVICRRFW